MNTSLHSCSWLRSVAAEMKFRLRLKLGSPIPDRSLFSPPLPMSADATAAAAAEEAARESEWSMSVEAEAAAAVESLAWSAASEPSEESFLAFALYFAVLRFFFCRGSRMTELCSGSTFWT